ncbi:MAG: peptidoglycan glycosyltransferase [bacterium LCO1.1]|uniref:Peptidoglycan glycosyltransferase n=1 Tax=Candidatus Weimeria bifida TaxID=2599074 RepID=A0A6N7IYG3_9FIRM|nr:peptidoglycan glycosyltransferase [Candidatus Weimeria bifida]
MIILICRLFYLQIIRGSSYRSNYNLKIERTEPVNAARGNIYDRKGRLLAYNDLAYTVTLSDAVTYTKQKDHYKKLNAVIYNLIKNIEKNGDTIDTDFGIVRSSDGKLSFRDSGSAVDRFRADVFGEARVSDLNYDSKLHYNKAQATPKQIMDYLYSRHMFYVSSSYSDEMRFKIAVIRYKIWLNRYQQYMSTPIAYNVSDKTVVYVKENSDQLPGADIRDDTVRKYSDPEAFASIIGYTGTISSEEYAKKHKKDSTVTINDQVGKSGIEKVMESYLAGKKGYRKIYANSQGKALSVTDEKKPVSGDNVYLSIDKSLQKKTYTLLEKEIAGILNSKIVNTKEYHLPADGSGANVVVPVYDVYYSFVKNDLIDIDKMAEKGATDIEHQVSDAFNKHQESAISFVKDSILSANAPAYGSLSEEGQEYSTYIIKTLREDKILSSKSKAADDPYYKQWSDEKISVYTYLKYCLSKGWIDYTKFSMNQTFVDSSELYKSLTDYIVNDVMKSDGFKKIIFHYALLNDEISGSSLCAILYDQGVLKKDQATRDALLSGRLAAFSFVKDKINKLQLTPGMLGLEPSSGSSVMMDAKTGRILALVSYPGYDNNKLANNVDNSYYSYLLQNTSNPLYNFATQQRTAPGSTFKLVSSTAGLSEGVISTASTITDKGVFEKVSNKPKCWIYPGTHGTINVSEAIRDSCNYFFYEVGWRLAGGDNNYVDSRGIKRIRKYASLYGLGEKTGVEIQENKSHIATEFPVMAAIGQSDHNYTTVALARYVTAVASSGNVYKLTLLDHVESPDGKTIKTYKPKLKRKITSLNSSGWAAIHSGMKMVVENLDSFNGFPIEVAGKTGTAQQSGHANHALFIGYAPYSDPKVTIATRIAYGYTSHNAAAISKDILGCYFHVKSSEDRLKADAGEITSNGAVTD